MLRIRLRRVGKKKQPMYRIVVADSHAPRDGRFVEAIGQYHPLEEPSKIVLDEERARHWLGKGAQPSDRVSKILAIQGIAEIPEKLKTRIALGEQRGKEAQAEKAKAAKEAASEPAEARDASAQAEASSEASADAEAVAEPATEEKPTAEATAEPVTEEKPAVEATAEPSAEAAEPTDASANQAEASDEAKDDSDASAKN